MLFILFIFLSKITFLIMRTFLVSPRLMIWTAWSFQTWMRHVLLLLVPLLVIFGSNTIMMVIGFMPIMAGIVLFAFLFIYLWLSTKTAYFVIAEWSNHRFVQTNFIACNIFRRLWTNLPISFFLWGGVSDVLDIFKIFFVIHLGSFSLAKGGE